MKCEFEYCIYNRERVCVLDEVEINSAGMCGECEMADVPPEVLEEYKRRRLEVIEAVWERRAGK